MSHNLWRLFAGSVVYAQAEHIPASILDVSQGVTGTSAVKVYNIWHYNASLVGVSGVFLLYSIRRVGGSQTMPPNLIPVPAHTADILPREVTCGSYRSMRTGSIFRKYIRETNEWARGVNSIMQWEFDVPMALVWDAGYGDSNIQPLTARAGQGIAVVQETASSTTTNTQDVEMEFATTDA
ncbi:hypothetical protein Rctr197k_087 [Virus Rctr197k]|nr:hypothetical protein Rctr197k_087 [Virus Rctr197k]